MSLNKMYDNILQINDYLEIFEWWHFFDSIRNIKKPFQIISDLWWIIKVNLIHFWNYKKYYNEKFDHLNWL